MTCIDSLRKTVSGATHMPMNDNSKFRFRFVGKQANGQYAFTCDTTTRKNVPGLSNRSALEAHTFRNGVFSWAEDAGLTTDEYVLGNGAHNCRERPVFEGSTNGGKTLYLLLGKPEHVYAFGLAYNPEGLTPPALLEAMAA